MILWWYPWWSFIDTRIQHFLIPVLHQCYLMWHNHRDWTGDSQQVIICATSLELMGTTGQICAQKLPLRLWVIKKSTTGRCQNAPVLIHHTKYKYRNSYICSELSSRRRGNFTCFHKNYFKENRSLFVLTLLRSGRIELHFENCPWFPPFQGLMCNPLCAL